MVAGASPAEEPSYSLEDAVAYTLAYRAQGLSLRDAVKRAAQETGFPKNTLYNAALNAEDS